MTIESLIAWASQSAANKAVAYQLGGAQAHAITRLLEARRGIERRTACRTPGFAVVDGVSQAVVHSTLARLVARLTHLGRTPNDQGPSPTAAARIRAGR